MIRRGFRTKESLDEIYEKFSLRKIQISKIQSNLTNGSEARFEFQIFIQRKWVLRWWAKRKTGEASKFHLLSVCSRITRANFHESVESAARLAASDIKRFMRYFYWQIRNFLCSISTYVPNPSRWIFHSHNNDNFYVRQVIKMFTIPPHLIRQDVTRHR